MRQRKLMNQINVVPYIDVMLVLLVIFMVTAPLVTPGVVELPSIGKAATIPATPIEIVVKADGSLVVRERGKAGEVRISQAELASVIQERQQGDAERPVLIAGDKDARYELVVKVMDELQRQNVKKVGLLVRQESR